MSFRVEGETPDEQLESIEEAIRYLYKCCELTLTSFELLAAGRGDISDGEVSERWYVTLGDVDLESLYVAAPAPPSSDITFSLYVDGADTGESITLTTAAADAAAVLSPVVSLTAGQYVQLVAAGGPLADGRVSIFGTSTAYCPSFGGQFASAGKPT